MYSVWQTTFIPSLLLFPLSVLHKYSVVTKPAVWKLMRLIIAQAMAAVVLQCRVIEVQCCHHTSFYFVHLIWFLESNSWSPPPSPFISWNSSLKFPSKAEQNQISLQPWKMSITALKFCQRQVWIGNILQQWSFYRRVNYRQRNGSWTGKNNKSFHPFPRHGTVIWDEFQLQ